MFTVPGWSLSADKLKTQTVIAAPDPVTNGQANGTGHRENKSKKRKRAERKNIEVTGENLGELWRKTFETKSFGRDPGGESGKKKRKDAKDGERANGIDRAAGGDDGSKASVRENGAKTGPLKSKDDLNDAEAWQTMRDGEVKKNKKERAREKGLKRQADANGVAQEANDGDIRVFPETLVAGDFSEGVRTSSKLGQENKRQGLTNGHKTPTKSDTIAQSGLPQGDEGRAKYERRIAKALRKREQRALKQASGELPPPRPEASTASDPASKAAKHKQKQEKKRLNKPEITPPPRHPTTASTYPPTKPSPILPTQPTSTVTTQLTPLQTKMSQKLTAARFRHLNETLYTTPSNEALALFTRTPSAYSSYHAGFRAQVAVWPSNPIDGFIEDVRARAVITRDRGGQGKAFRVVKRGKKGQGGVGGGVGVIDESYQQQPPLPRTNGICMIADLGCGDATLAGTLTPLSVSEKLNVQILSFDLARGDGPNADLVTIADITDLAQVGVKDGSVDVAICCLSLMGTNWVKIVEECGRVVRGGGEVWVAEIRSRFARRGEKGGKVNHSVGNQHKKGRQWKKKGGNANEKAADDDDDDGAPMTLEEELEEPSVGNAKDETDVSAFVAVWRKRGFRLMNEPDVNNKMFVKMRFVRERDGGDARFMTNREKMAMRGKKFIEREGEVGEEGEVDEGKVLKPCVYKTR